MQACPRRRDFPVETLRIDRAVCGSFSLRAVRLHLHVDRVQISFHVYSYTSSIACIMILAMHRTIECHHLRAFQSGVAMPMLTLFPRFMSSSCSSMISSEKCPAPGLR